MLGQGLDFSIPLRLESGETLTAECVGAEIVAGDSRVASAQVRVRIDGAESGAPTLRVVTLTAIDEPVVTVNLALGCPPKLSRRFVLLADPPPAAAPSAPIPLPVESQPPPAAAEPQRAPPPAPAAAAEPAAKAEPARPRVQASQGTPGTQRPARQARRAPRTGPGVAVAPPAARLRLDPVEAPRAPPAAVASAESAASAAAAEAAAAAASAAAAEAAQAAASAASAAAQRIATLEQTIAKMQADAAADRAALRQLRQRAADGDASERWVLLLWLAIGALGLLSLWLALKLRALQRERQQAWWNAAAAGGTGAPTAPASAQPAPTVASPDVTTSAEATLSAFGSTRPEALPSGSGVFTPDPSAPDTVEPPEPAMQRTQALPPGWRDEPEARDVTIEELIDLEQQAEFFIVLGQEDAAVDLLVEHLRSTGGGSPMPYLKLLEIYRRRDDREAYERTRARFNHRFNAYAPDWDSDAQERWLEDYPAIIARLQMAWASPLDAMAELESLLFRKTRGELFEMPAYRDVLFLYSLARDLLDREPLESGNVDVLLPISEASQRTQPMSLDESPEGMPSGMSQLDDQPTVPVDLDLTQPVIPDSLFGEPTLPLPQRKR